MGNAGGQVGAGRRTPEILLLPRSPLQKKKITKSLVPQERIKCFPLLQGAPRKKTYHVGLGRGKLDHLTEKGQEVCRLQEDGSEGDGNNTKIFLSAHYCVRKHAY